MDRGSWEVEIREVTLEGKKNRYICIYTVYLHVSISSLWECVPNRWLRKAVGRALMYRSLSKRTLAEGLHR